MKAASGQNSACAVMAPEDDSTMFWTARSKNWSKFGLEALDGSPLAEDRKWQTKSFSQEERWLPPSKTNYLLTEQDQNGDQSALENTDLLGGGRGGAIGIGGYSGGQSSDPPPPEAPKKLLVEICRCLDLLNAKDVDADTLVKAAANSSGQPARLLDGAGYDAGAAGATFGSRPLRKPDQDDQTVRVTNLPDFVTQEALELLFNRIGDVQRTFLVRNKETHVSRGFAFITFRSKSDAQKAIDTLNGRGFMGSVLTVECARRKAE